MKFAALIEYTPDRTKIRATWSAHRQHLRDVLEGGRLLAAGPFGKDLGALQVYEAESASEVEGWIRGDPFCEAGVIAGWQVRPLADWSAKAAGPGKADETEPVADMARMDGLAGILDGAAGRRSDGGVAS